MTYIHRRKPGLQLKRPVKTVISFLLLKVLKINGRFVFSVLTVKDETIILIVIVNNVYPILFFHFYSTFYLLSEDIMLITVPLQGSIYVAKGQ